MQFHKKCFRNKCCKKYLNSQIKMPSLFKAPVPQYQRIDDDDVSPTDLYRKENIAMAMAYFSVGLVGSFMTTPLNVYMVNVLNAEPNMQNTIGILQTLPWSLKLIFGFLSDSVAIGGMHRKPYLTIGALVYSGAFITYALAEIHDVLFLAVIVFIGTLGLVQMDVMADTMCCERSKFEPEATKGQMQASCYSIRFSGGLIGALAGATISNQKSWGWGLTFPQVSFWGGLIPFLLVAPWLYSLKEKYKKRAPSVPDTVENSSVNNTNTTSPSQQHDSGHQHHHSYHKTTTVAIELPTMMSVASDHHQPRYLGHPNSKEISLIKKSTSSSKLLDHHFVSSTESQNKQPHRLHEHTHHADISSACGGGLTCHSDDEDEDDVESRGVAKGKVSVVDSAIGLPSYQQTATAEKGRQHQLHNSHDGGVTHEESKQFDSLGRVVPGIEPRQPGAGGVVDDALPSVQIPDDNSSDDEVSSLSSQLHEIWETVQLQAVWRPMAFVYVYNLLQIPNVAWQSYLQLSLHFEPWVLGLTVTLGSFMTLAGILAYKYFFFNASWRAIYVWSTVLTAFFSLLQLALIFQWNVKYLHLGNYLFSLGDDVISAYISGIQFLPMCIMYMRLCPDGAEGTSYSMLTTFGNVALVCACSIGNSLTGLWDVSNSAMRRNDTDGLWRLSLLTSCVAVVPLFMLHLLPADADEQDRLSKSQSRSKVGGALFLVVLFGSLIWTIASAIQELLQG